MKRGQAQIEVISVFCPHCREAWFGAKNGSSLIDVFSLESESGLKPGQVVECEACKQKFKLPRLLASLGR